MIAGNSLKFEENVSEGDAPITEYSWEATRNGNLVEDGDGETFAFTPGEKGDYMVSLTATDGDGKHGSETVTVLVDELDEYLVELASEEYPSKPKAVAALLTDLRTVRESEYDDLEDLLDTAAQVSILEEEVAKREARIEDLQRQVRAANSKDEQVSKLATSVEEERRATQQWREAGLLRKTKWTLFGMPSKKESA